MKKNDLITQKDVDRFNNTGSLNSKIEAYWNGVEVEAKEVNVIVADAPEFPKYWARDLVGKERKALKIIITKAPKNANGDIVDVNPPEIFYIDNENGEGLRKVTEGMGMFDYPHSSLNIEKELSS